MPSSCTITTTGNAPSTVIVWRKLRDPSQRAKVCRRIEDWIGAQAGWTVLGITESPITGPEGNVEFLIAGIRDQAAA